MYLRRFIHPATPDERQESRTEITAAASPGFDFYVMVVLSSSIATLGLITDSAAVIIGAMLLAPLMSPIIAIGLATVTGEVRLAQDSLWTLTRGAILAVLLAIIMTAVNRYLPFVLLQELPGEVVSRTHPSPNDLSIAMAGGLAAAYAMTRKNLSAALPGVAIATALMPPLCTIGIGIAVGRWDVAGGACLLFLTNTITIAFAAALVFFLRGFSPGAARRGWRLPRPLLVSAGLTLLLLVPLAYFSFQFFQAASLNVEINDVVRTEVARLNGAELVELSVNRSQGHLDLIITLRSNTPLNYAQVVQLQANVVARLKQRVSLKVNQVLAEQLDPLIPPTPTPTTRYTPTLTLTPSVTASLTPSATWTPTFTPTPALAKARPAPLPGLRLFQAPGGPAMKRLSTGEIVQVLDERQAVDGVIWIQVRDAEGLNGWIPEAYLQLVTLTPSATATSTPGR